MEKTNYEKPEVKLVSIRNDRAVANTCWGGHGNSTTWYYDISGQGYVSFQIGGGKCTLNLYNVTYYDKQNDESPEMLLESDPKYHELYDALMTSGGDTGNPFKGEGLDFIPDNPDPEWS